MILSLILGVILGAAAVFFIVQNTVLVTVSFLSWQFESSLAAVLFLTIVCGIVITLLFLLPSLVRDSINFSRLKRENRELEDDLTKTKTVLADVSSRLNHPDVLVVEKTPQ